jgi:hypothetical protein
MSTFYTLHKPKLQDMLKIITINKEYYNKLLISFENRVHIKHLSDLT